VPLAPLRDASLVLATAGRGRVSAAGRAEGLDLLAAHGVPEAEREAVMNNAVEKLRSPVSVITDATALR
jgi:hypothetical protein